MGTNGEFRLVRPDAQQALVGVQVLMGGNTEMTEGFLAYARQQNVDLTRQVLALCDDVIAGMCLWIPSPGRTALLFAPRLGGAAQVTEAGSACAVTGAIHEARQAGVILVQAMVETTDAPGTGLFSLAGLYPLARLIYMERDPPLTPPPVILPAGVHLEPYSPATHALFRAAILASYQQTLDCPALSGLRDVDDVIAGHQAVGLFDPQLWSVVVENGQARGCLLLAEISARHGLELVYLGLAPAARRRGLGRILMNRALAVGARRHFSVMTLAVDADNLPALALYRRCGYRRVAERLAMIKTLEEKPELRTATP